MHPFTHFGLAIGLLVPSTLVAAISTFTDRSTFNAAVSPTPLTVETFLTTGSGGQIPSSPGFYTIPSGTLDSSTILGSLPAGVIQTGVTYSTAVDSKNLFVIDTGGGFDGGFLEGIKLGSTTFPLTVTFDHPASAFGFDTSNEMGATFNLQIKFSAAADYSSTLTGVTDLSHIFFGFQSSSADITQVVLTGTRSSFSFGLDNFTFTNDPVVGDPPAGSAPEPSSLTILSVGALAIAMRQSRRRRAKAVILQCLRGFKSSPESAACSRWYLW